MSTPPASNNRRLVMPRPFCVSPFETDNLRYAGMLDNS
jgi:hypothetical protein